MKHNPTFRSLVLMVILAPLLALSGCISDSDDGNGTVPFIGKAAIVPGVNPAFDSITEVAVSTAPGGAYDDVLVPDTDYTYDPLTESISITGSVATGGGYARITGLATVTGTQSSYTVYTYVANLDKVAANELTSQAVALVAAGDAANFDAALALLEAAYGLPAGSAAEPSLAGDRPAALTSVLSSLSPGFAGEAFDVNGFDQTALDAAPLAYQDCIAQGGLAWDSWHKTDAGGAGNLPAGETDADYTRCKACHGWDQQGTDGGYVRRSRNAGRANAGYQDPNNCDLPGANLFTCTPSRNISGDASFGSGIAVEIPAGGRTWAEGSAEFDSLWGPGAILGNRHPDLSAANSGGPTAEQLSCLTAFLNAPMARADQVFAAMDTTENPVLYTPVATADAAAGETYYGTNCSACHSDPSDDSTATTDGLPGTGGMIGYLNGDGKFSEFMHKMHWGIPNSDPYMSRDSMGNPTAADVANVVAYMQAIPFMELSAAQVVSPLAGITARGSGIYTLTETDLEYNITLTGSLSSAITDAEFHHGRVGVNGASLHTLEPFVAGNSTGTWAGLGAANRTALLAGDVYVIINTVDNPAGEIRGQVKVTQAACFEVTPSLNVEPGTEVMLDAGCSDPLTLTYAWTLGVPVGSTTAVLSSTDTVTSSFTPDVDGDYTISLTVNDGLIEDTVEKTVTAATGGGGPGQTQYVDECGLCHAAGSFDTTTALGGNDLVADNSVVVSDLAGIDDIMASVSPLSPQEVLDLQAFLDSL